MNQPNPTPNHSNHLLSAPQAQMMQTLHQENEQLSRQKTQLEDENRQLRESLALPVDPRPPSPDLEFSSLVRQLQSMEQDAASLSHALAESGMSRVAKERWVDLRRCVCVEHRPGEFLIQSPLEATPQSRITLDWQPGCLWLLESFQGSEEAAIVLPLPSVRHPQQWAVPEPTSSQPPRQNPVPATSRAVLASVPGSPPKTTVETHPLEPMPYPEWQAHCQPTISLAEQAQTRSAKQAADDEEALVVAAMEEIQTRRLKPKDHPDQTIAEALEALAAKLRTQAHPELRGQTGPVSRQ